MNRQYDPVELKVIWDRVIAITQDAGATMVRTTFSPIVQEGNDYCCSLIDLRGRQLAEPPHTIPSFTGTLPFTVRHFLSRYPAADLKPGDSLITNDSWLGTGHLNDFNIASPIFDTRGRLLAIAACTAHMTDIGGSINYGATRDIHEEGLRLPIMKIVSEGKLNTDLTELIAFNVRLPEECMGDLTGMLAANKTMADRLVEMVEDQGIDDFTSVSDEIHRRSEEAMRSAIAELSTGHYEGGVTFDSAGFPVQICVAIDVADRAVRVNFDGTSEQIRNTSINVVMNYTYAFTVYPLKLLISPRLATNDGCLRPLEITAPIGSILNSTWPAGGFSRNYVGHMIHAALFSALEGVLPDQIWGHSGSAPTGPDCVMGTRRDGKPFVHLFFAGSGGTGAMPQKDGETCNFPTNARATSVEVTEASAPILFERRELLTDSAGAGTHRGGLGSAWTIRNIGSESITYTGQVGRINYPALGLLGGEDGQPNRLYYNGEPEERGWGRWELRPGDSFRKEGAGGGGLGSPLLRDPASVLEDVLEGSVSREEARETYGVLIQADRVVGATTHRERLKGTTSSQGG